MPDQIQQAIALIKSGKNRDAHQILLKILNSDPNNDQAWLWMSAVVSEDKRQYCIEKALEINPNNQQAKHALSKLTQVASKSAITLPSEPSPPPPESPSTSIPITQPPSPEPVNSPPLSSLSALVTSLPEVPQPASQVTGSIKSSPEFWINPERKATYITALLENELVSATTDPSMAKQVQAKLQQGAFPLDILADNHVIPFNNITEVSQTMSSLRVYYTENNSAKSTRLECDDTAMAEAILNALQKRLGAKFERNSAPLGIGKAVLVPLVFMMIILAATTFCYFGAAEIASGEVTPTGSARTRGIAALLGLIGPTGVACIGGVLFLVALGLMIYLIAKPPLVTKLTPVKTKPKTKKTKR